MSRTSKAVPVDPHDTVSTISHGDQCRISRKTLHAEDDMALLERFSQGRNKFTKWFKELSKIYIGNPLTQKYFRSETAVNCEKIRHIKLKYWYIVHPLSKLRIYFEIWQLMLYTSTVIVKPMNGALNHVTIKRIYYFKELSTILDLLSWLTIIFKFFNGYIINQTKTIILEPKRIAWHYISRPYFACDVLSSIPVFPAMHFLDLIYGTDVLVITGVLFALCELKLIRMVSVIHYIGRIAFLLVPKLVRLYFSKENQHNLTWYAKYELMDKPFFNFYTVMCELDEYMKQKRLPFNLQDRIRAYYNFKFQGKYFKESMIHDMLSEKLKKEVNVHMCRSLIESVTLFATLTVDQISNVVGFLKPEIFLPKDTIFQSGTPGESMYFISSGTVAVYTHSGREDQRRSVTVIAIEITHVYILEHKKFAKYMLKNPKVMKKIRKVAYRRSSIIRKYEKEYKKRLFERRFKGFNMICISNPLTQKYFKSETAVNDEMVRQIELNCWYIVHPLSKLRHYVSSAYFTCDILSSIPVFPVIHFWEILQGSRRVVLIGILYVLCELKVIRIISVINYINHLAILLVPKLVRLYFTKESQGNLTWYAKSGLFGKPFSTIYTHCVFRIVLAVTLLSNRSMKVKFQSIICELNEYMKQKELPLDLQSRIRNYYNFKYQGKYFREDMVHGMLSDKLKTEVNLHMCRSLIQNVSIFADLTPDEIVDVVKLLTSEIFLPKDTIFQAGSYGACMYFISSGTVAVYTHSGRERRNFLKYMLRNPKVLKKVQKVAHRRSLVIDEYERAYKKRLFEQVHGGQYAEND
nr:unnamed protein product [Callosobruchus analis]